LGYTFKILKLKELSIGLQINNIFNEKYETSGWAYSYYLQTNNNQQTRNADIAYYPQAGINFMFNLNLRF
jgi:iron complex outermembrane receptor protein